MMKFICLFVRYKSRIDVFFSFLYIRDASFDLLIFSMFSIHSSLLLLLALIALCHSLAEVTSWTDGQCLDYGFNREALSCGTCRQSVGLVFSEQSEVFENCLRCCSELSSDRAEEEVFERAVLYVDRHALRYLPDLEQVVKNKKQLRLVVKYRFGPPQLLMFKGKEDEEASEEISVQSWTKDTLVDYLSTHYRPLLDKNKPSKK